MEFHTYLMLDIHDDPLVYLFGKVAEEHAKTSRFPERIIVRGSCPNHDSFFLEEENGKLKLVIGPKYWLRIKAVADKHTVADTEQSFPDSLFCIKVEQEE